MSVHCRAGDGGWRGVDGQLCGDTRAAAVAHGIGCDGELTVVLPKLNDRRNTPHRIPVTDSHARTDRVPDRTDASQTRTDDDHR